MTELHGEVEACGGDTVAASLCKPLAPVRRAKGDTLLSLHDTYYPICDGIHNCPAYTYNTSLCSRGQRLLRPVLPADLRRVPVTDNNPVCSTFYLRQGCYSDERCNGTTVVSVEHTEWTKVAPFDYRRPRERHTAHALLE